MKLTPTLPRTFTCHITCTFHDTLRQNPLITQDLKTLTGPTTSFKIPTLKTLPIHATPVKHPSSPKTCQDTQNYQHSQTPANAATPATRAVPTVDNTPIVTEGIPRILLQSPKEKRLADNYDRMGITSPENVPPAEVVDVDEMDTLTTSRSVVREGRKGTVRPLKYHYYILNKVWAMLYQLCDTAHPLHDVQGEQKAQLTVSIKFHQFYTRTGRMCITLLPAEKSRNGGKIAWGWSMGVFSLSMSCPTIAEPRNLRLVVTTLSKHPDANFNWACEYIRARCVFRCHEEVLTA